MTTEGGVKSTLITVQTFDRDPIDRWAHIYTLDDIFRYGIRELTRGTTSTMMLIRSADTGNRLVDTAISAPQTLHCANHRWTDNGDAERRAPVAAHAGAPPPGALSLRLCSSIAMDDVYYYTPLLQHLSRRDR